MKTTNSRKVICAGCLNTYLTSSTHFYRNKRWCGHLDCKNIIDAKVKHANYKKAQKKIQKGTFRSGVKGELREFIKTRDNHTCRSCFKTIEYGGLQVHHIIPVSSGGNDDYDNLILLCHDCHTGVHQDGWERHIDKFFKYTKSLSNH